MLVELKEQSMLILQYSWPMVVMTVLIVVSLRIGHIVKYKEKAVLYKELFALLFIIYILCLFHAVTYQDVSWSTANFVPFKEILRYDLGSSLFYKNIFGNMLLFLPYGIFVTSYLDIKKPFIIVLYAFLTSLSIEFIQSIIGRVFDVDDIILNVVGAFLGYLIWKLLMKFSSNLPKCLKKEWVINLFAICLIGGVVWFLIP